MHGECNVEVELKLFLGQKVTAFIIADLNIGTESRNKVVKLKAL